LKLWIVVSPTTYFRVINPGFERFLNDLAVSFVLAGFGQILSKMVLVIDGIGATGLKTAYLAPKWKFAYYFACIFINLMLRLFGPRNLQYNSLIIFIFQRVWILSYVGALVYCIYVIDKFPNLSSRVADLRRVRKLVANQLPVEILLTIFIIVFNLFTLHNWCAGIEFINDMFNTSAGTGIMAYALLKGGNKQGDNNATKSGIVGTKSDGLSAVKSDA